MLEDFYKLGRHKAWREKVLKRDKYLCQECLRYGRKTEATIAHHIKHADEYPELISSMPTSILSFATWLQTVVRCVLHATTKCIRKRVETISGSFDIIPCGYVAG